MEKKTWLLIGAGAVALWLLTRKKAAAAPVVAKPGVKGYLGQVPYQAWGWEGAQAAVPAATVAAPAGYVWNGAQYVPSTLVSGGCPAGMYMTAGGCSYQPQAGYGYQQPYYEGYQQPYYGYQQPYGGYSQYGYQSPYTTEAMYEVGGMQPSGPVPQVSNV